MTVRRELSPLAFANQAKLNAVDAYAEVISAAMQHDAEIALEEDAGDYEPQSHSAGGRERGSTSDPQAFISDIREYDIPYYLRVAIDNRK